MPNKKHNSFLKFASGVIALAILLGGTLLHEKNAGLFSEADANLGEASIVTETGTIPTIFGNCQQNTNLTVLSTLQPNQSIIATVSNLDSIITGTASFDAEAMEVLAVGIAADRVEASILESSSEYEFLVKDGQISFWKCVLQKNQLFSSVLEASSLAESEPKPEFFSETATFQDQIKDFEYGIQDTKEVDNFLNFIEVPEGNVVLETTVLNSSGEVFFKIFETHLEGEYDYTELREDLRDRVGITNLRPAVFGPDSYYWMWGEDDKMAASVFFLEGNTFGVSYQTKHFSHIRRVIDSLMSTLDAAMEKVDIVNERDEFENVTLEEFENMSEEDLGSDVVQKINNLDQLEEVEGILSEDLSSSILDAEPLEIPEDVDTEEDLPITM